MSFSDQTSATTRATTLSPTGSAGPVIAVDDGSDGASATYNRDYAAAYNSNNGVYGVTWGSHYTFPTAATTILKAQYGAASATATLQFYAASTSATATYSVTATGSIGSATPYSAPLTTKAATVTVTVVSGGSALQDYPVTFTTTWTGAAAGDVTPVSGSTGRSVVKTDVNGKATLALTNNAPADSAQASVAIQIGGTAGTTQVINWVKSKPASVSVDPEGPMTVALKAATKATFTVLDAFGKPVAGEVVNLAVAGANNTTASPLRIPSATTDANGQVSYTLTDALAVAADI
jgi:hypothetical protein